MPELPEVENVRRHLQSLIVGKRVEQVEVRLPRLIRTPADPEEFSRLLAGRTIESVDRRGKYLMIALPPHLLISHLRMEGQYRLCERDEPELPHTHVVFRFTDGTELRYRDVRQFGTMDIVTPAHSTPVAEELPKGVRELGPEPFDPSLDARVFLRRLAGRRAPLKAVLLDQTCLAGLGNIYADEALFGAGLHPELPANCVSLRQAERLLAAIRDVLARAIEAGGSSVKSFVDGYGRHGGFQMELSVYARRGQPCPRCGTAVEKMRVAGRGTHVCPHCQPRPRLRALRRARGASAPRVRSRPVGSAPAIPGRPNPAGPRGAGKAGGEVRA
ncbi:MAG: bifunctional DNA-formamidopyrimidine glycosylase/DNA-(apurinic or apyrimidinic site) lyase [Alicyclobacillus sp.]|nr:bifunctional DNA-formamidopyrimidine glycosylase/DNA-(apurinic or apyrimidinic site) lyase [Alicyclobacillus sp.]